MERQVGYRMSLVERTVACVLGFARRSWILILIAAVGCWLLDIWAMMGSGFWALGALSRHSWMPWPQHEIIPNKTRQL